MPIPKLNPFPRIYPDLVTLIRRADGGANIATGIRCVEDIRSWLLSGSLHENTLLDLVEGLIWRMVAADIPVERISLHVGTLHPQLLGYYWLWNKKDGLVDELKVDIAGYDIERYKRSPLKLVIEQGQTYRAKTSDLKESKRFPLLNDLNEQGITEYCILPIGASSSQHNAISLSTSENQGFSDSDIEGVRSIMDIFGLHVDRHIAQKISENILNTYLGSIAGRKVIEGSIQRGSGEPIEDIIWVSDLRGFSTLSDNLPEPAVLAVLNEYFSVLIESIVEHDGEVLKFMGDGLLAIFPVDDHTSAIAANASITAAKQAVNDLHRLNENPPESINGIKGWHPLNTGIALHSGEVFFGNLGSPDRLDFTVIGSAVNETSRIEALTKSLGCSILVSEPVAHLLDYEIENRGSHQLRGITDSVTLFSVETVKK